MQFASFAISVSSRAFGRFSLLTEMAFRANYLLKITVEILWIVLLLLFYKTIFAKTSVVADWTEDEYLFFLGCYYALEGLMETLFLGNFSEFSELVRKGDLDLILLQPIDEQFVVSCRTIDWSTVPNVFMGIGLMIYGLTRMGWPVSPCKSLVFRRDVSVRGGDVLQLHADAVEHGRVDGAEPEPVRVVVAVHEPDALSEGDLPRPARRPGRLAVHVSDPGAAGEQRAGPDDGASARPGAGRVHDRGDGGACGAEPVGVPPGAAELSECEQLRRIAATAVEWTSAKGDAYDRSRSRRNDGATNWPPEHERDQTSVDARRPPGAGLVSADRSGNRLTNSKRGKRSATRLCGWSRTVTT